MGRSPDVGEPAASGGRNIRAFRSQLRSFLVRPGAPLLAFRSLRSSRDALGYVRRVHGDVDEYSS